MNARCLAGISRALGYTAWIGDAGGSYRSSTIFEVSVHDVPHHLIEQQTHETAAVEREVDRRIDAVGREPRLDGHTLLAAVAAPAVRTE